MHRLYAYLTGRSWSPCPLCGKPSGGHEWKERNGLSATITVEEHPGGRSGRGICPTCTLAGLGDPRWTASARWTPPLTAPPPDDYPLKDVDSFELGTRWMAGEISKDDYFDEVRRRSHERNQPKT
jgi:hypothetical protein